MRNRYILAAVLLLMSACNKKQPKLFQEKTVNGFVMRMEYMPSNDVNLLHFVLNVTESDGTPMKAVNANKFSYGLDSLFGIVNVTDTLHPVDVIRVANGNIGGMQYMILFDRPPAFSKVNFFLYFRDQLFTQQFIKFPLKGDEINHIDSLRLRDDN
jgi:hypothetical protein